MTSDKLQQNILSTYFTLRMGIVVLSVLLPVILYVGGKVGGIDLLNSMSAYYGGHSGLMRNWLVGILWTVGSFLYLYKGYSTLENILLNFAGSFAVGVAMIPCNCWPEAIGPDNTLHAVVAVAFFLCMACVCLFCAADTISLLPDQKTRDRFKRQYRIIGVLLVASPLSAIAVSYVLRQFDNYKFFVEAFGVWVFAAYWLVKSREFSITSAEKRALHGQLENRRGRGVVPVAAAGAIHPAHDVDAVGVPSR
jgi:hypothetical protein